MSKVIAIDFDGTCVTHDFPNMGRDIGAIPVLQDLVVAGHRLILFTMRSDVTNPISVSKEIIGVPGDYLTQAVNWFKENKIPLYGVQVNPTQRHWTTSPKCYANLYIDDAALGVPLVTPENERPYVDWIEVRKLLIKQGYL